MLRPRLFLLALLTMGVLALAGSGRAHAGFIAGVSLGPSADVWQEGAGGQPGPPRGP